jgi:tetratricopeptide (TPR) repeat protein/tRNA A-37 threonylcarbamoyl transferase component Bud32
MRTRRFVIPALFSALLMSGAAPCWAADGSAGGQREYSEREQQQVEQRYDQTMQQWEEKMRERMGRNGASADVIDQQVGRVIGGMRERIAGAPNSMELMQRQIAIGHRFQQLHTAQSRSEKKKIWGQIQSLMARQFQDQAFEGMERPGGGTSGFGRDFDRRRGLPPETQRAISQANGMDDNPYVKSKLADSYLKWGEPEKAAMAAQEAISLDPSNPDPYSTLGASRMEVGDWEGAAEASRQALERDPKHRAAAATYQLSKGRANADSSAVASQPAAAPAPAAFRGFADPVRNLNPVAQRDPRGSVRLSNRAQTLLKGKNYRAAHDAANKAIALDKTNVGAYYTKSLAQMRSKDYSGALTTLEAALKYAGGNSQAKSMIWTAKAKVLNLMRQHQDALVAADTAIGFDDRNAEAYIQKAWAMDRLAKPRADIKKATCLAARYSGRYRSYCDKFDVFADGQLADLLAGEISASALLNQGEASNGSDWAGMLGMSRRALVMTFSGLFAALMIGIGVLRGFGKDAKGALNDAMKGVTRQSPNLQTEHTVLGQAQTLMPGTVIGGLFTVDKQIGTGGMGIVYQGTDSALHRKVAIKKMRDEIRSDPRERERFVKEARTVAAMHQSNIVDIYSIVDDGQDVYLIFEYVAGKTIHEMLHEKKRFTFSEALGVMRGAAAALDYAHKRGIIHRDLKPSNIMIDSDRQVKVMDFGVARQSKDSMTKLTNTIVGTPPYMAPEQEQGMIRKQSDVYGLGVLLYEMVTGQMPFQGVGAGMLMSKINKTFVPPSRVADGLPDGFDRLIDKVLDPDPEKRYQSCADIVRAMEALVTATSK